MSKSQRGFEPLEPRYLLSSMGLANGNLSAIRTATESYAPPAESQERPAVVAEEQTREPLAPAIIESLDTSDTPDSPPVAPPREPAIDSKTKTISPVLVAVNDANTTVRTSADQLSTDNKEPRSLSKIDAIANVAEEGKPTTSDREQTDGSETDDADPAVRQQPAKDDTPAPGNATTDNDELADTDKAISAVARGQNDSAHTSTNGKVDDDIEAKLHRQETPKDDRLAVGQSNAASNTNSTTLPRQTARQSDTNNPFAMASDHVFSEEQSESGERWTASGMLPRAEGALLLVTLGKPLTRLVGGDARVDTINLDSGLLGTRTTFDRARRNRRKAAEARDRWQRRPDARNTAWLPPEELLVEILPETVEAAEKQLQTPRSTEKPISARLADEVIFSYLDIDDNDRRGGRESRLPSPTSAYTWDGYTLVGGAVVVTLSGTISVLAADRHLRVRSQDRRVSPPPPTYTGRTLARI